MISKNSENDTLKNKARMVYTSTYPNLENNSVKIINDIN